MMKSTIALLLLGSSIPVWAQTTAGSDSSSSLQWSLTGRYRYEDSNYFDLKERKQFSHVRLRPQVTYDDGGKMKVVMEGQYAKIMGLPAYVPSGSAANTLTETSGETRYTGGNDGLALRQGYLDMKLSDSVDLILGRQALAYGDQVIIGPSDWGVYGRAFDAARLKWAPESWNVELFQAKVVEVGSANQTSGGDKDLMGLSISLLDWGLVKTWDLYSFYLSDSRNPTTAPADATRPNYFGDYGTRLVLDAADWSWKVEYAQNFGSEGSPYLDSKSGADMVDTTVSWKLGAQTLGLQIFRGGKNWRELFPTTNWALGRTDVLGRRNLTGVGLHHTAKWSDLWSTDVDVYGFTRTDKETAAYATDSSTTRGTLPSDSADVGSELDLVAKYQIDKKTTASLGMAFFNYGAYLKDSMADSSVKPHYGYLMFETKF